MTSRRVSRSSGGSLDRPPKSDDYASSTSRRRRKSTSLLFRMSLGVWMTTVLLGWRAAYGCLGVLQLQMCHEWYMKASSLLSLVLFLLYAYDKRLAITQTSLLHRVPENTLLGIALLGGWPGGVVGSVVWSHKTMKQPYLNILSAIILLHVVVVLSILLRWVQAFGYYCTLIEHCFFSENVVVSLALLLPPCPSFAHRSCAGITLWR